MVTRDDKKFTLWKTVICNVSGFWLAEHIAIAYVRRRHVWSVVKDQKYLPKPLKKCTTSDWCFYLWICKSTNKNPCSFTSFCGVVSADPCDPCELGGVLGPESGLLSHKPAVSTGNKNITIFNFKSYKYLIFPEWRSTFDIRFWSQNIIFLILKIVIFYSSRVTNHFWHQILK